MAANPTTNQQAPTDDGVQLATLDVREWALSKDGACWFPTKKGGSIRTREIEDVIKALEKARELSR